MIIRHAPLTVGLVLLLTGLPACSGPGQGGGALASGDAVAAQRSADRAAPITSDPAVVTIDGQPIGWTALRDELSELGGGAVVRERALDVRLRAELASRGKSLDPGAVDRERALLADSLASTGGSGTDTEDLTLRLRRAQGLGERRFAALLERTAMLRQLVQADVVVSDATVAQAFAIGHGPRHRARLITMGSHAQTASLRAELLARGGGAELSAAFSRAALDRSTDESRGSGGVLPPLSTEDPLWPSTIRSAVSQMKPGELSPVLALERGFALVLLDEVIPADGKSLEQVRPMLERQVRLRQERLLMDRLAQQLLQGGRGVRVLDPALQWSWRAGQSE
jgi:hypothetical protein